ncbi:MAG: 16S rRNA (cytosine(967)-C(5))-methyltransferase RsmB [Deltaproteobacteria bacterium]|nr:16S rRNA (cytosine(967)-C(5))-methyltransferase RsmB [Deltaproteobacteria bacterium]
MASENDKEVRAKKAAARPVTARSVAFNVLLRVESADSYADVLLSREAAGLSTRDAAFATELVYGTLRWLIKIDWIIDAFSKIKTQKLEHDALTALRLGVYQLFFLGGVASHAAVGESVELLGGANDKKRGFVNAVLRAADASKNSVNFPVLSKGPVKYISIVFSHPEWLVERWIANYGVKDALEMCQANLRVPPTVARVNTIYKDRAGLIEELGSAGIVARPTEYSPLGIEVLEKTWARLDTDDKRFYFQDEASQLVALLVAPKPGEIICDACAAPGGKATEMAEMMKDEGAVFALDKNPSRLKTVEKLAKRFSLKSIRTVVADAVSFAFQPSLLPGKDAELPEFFDAVLVDAPCTGLGVIRRTPEIKYRKTEADIKRMATEQVRILRNMAKLVRPGGRIVYSVCSIEPEETIEVAKAFLAENPEYAAENAAAFLPASASGLITDEGFVKTLPHLHNTDGFFAARFSRKAG